MFFDFWWVIPVALIALSVAYQLGRQAAVFREPAPGEEVEPGRRRINLPGAIPPTPGVLYKIAAELNMEVAHPGEYLSDPTFTRGVNELLQPQYGRESVLAYATGNHAVLACMALEALARCKPNEAVRKRLLEAIAFAGYVEQFFFLRALEAQTPRGEPLVGEALLGIAARRNIQWMEFAPVMVDDLAEFARARLKADERPTFRGRLQEEDPEPEAAEHLGKLMDRMRVEGLDPLRDELKEWEQRKVDFDFLESVGKVLREDDGRPVIPHTILTDALSEMEQALAGESPRSLLLIGESGVGKTVAAHDLFKSLRAKGWQIFQAGSAEVLAGQRYIGDLEERLQKLVRQLDSRRRILWYIPELHQMVWAGRHQFSRTSALDYLLPFIERGDLVVLGESNASGYEKLIQLKPRVATALQKVRIAALPAEATRALAREWADAQEGVEIDDGTLREAHQLAQQFLGDVAPPGNLLELLEMTRDRLEVGVLEKGSESQAPVRIGMDDLIVTLAQMTGLPRSILDEREGLDLESLRDLFRSRVMGQPEAVNCLVERVAMIKAGVTDPTRPAGVFLFAGPTGTGKTEIAKTLAEFLFGAPERMIRLDMSELQTQESLVRLLGDPTDDAPSEKSLVQEIRKKPFSVVLLDEFEKAHFNVWDLFLQVFDDGRLTDRRGNVANFRHAIIILTSNLGSMAAQSSLGFSELSGGFQGSTIRKAIKQAFRPELRNRIDRIVVFQPLTRETMREILNKELEEVFERRGLRNRGWAVEWDDAAIQFLLDRGFTPDMGARPLTRAIERYLLSPLAVTIVKHQAPAGDQFLFVRVEGDRLDVAFVDPDAAEEPPPAPEQAELPEDPGDTTALCRMAAHPGGTGREVALLGAHLERLGKAVAEESWAERKQREMSRMSDPEFWRNPGRFAALDRIEYMDRIEAGLRGTRSLHQRITGPRGEPRDLYPSNMIRRIAQRLFLLDTACTDVIEERPHEAFVLVEANPGTGAAGKQRAAFAGEIGRMYREWAGRRGMQLEILDESGEEDPAFQLLLAVSGFGAWSILRNEDGVHVFEEPGGRGRHDHKRYQVRVHIAPRPPQPPAAGSGVPPLQALRRQAREIFRDKGAGQLNIVRRYRREPSPLVRDTHRHWRTGLYDAVMAGDFDLMVGGSGEAG